MSLTLETDFSSQTGGREKEMEASCFSFSGLLSVDVGPTHRKQKVGFIVPADNKQEKSDLVSESVVALL